LPLFFSRLFIAANFIVKQEAKCKQRSRGKAEQVQGGGNLLHNNPFRVVNKILSFEGKSRFEQGWGESTE
jgi:hypothetical protein